MQTLAPTPDTAMIDTITRRKPAFPITIGTLVTHQVNAHDCQAAEVIAVSSNGRTATVRYCRQTILNGPTSGHAQALTPTGQGKQLWSIKSHPAGDAFEIKLDRRGNWIPAGGGPIRQGHHPYRNLAK